MTRRGWSNSRNIEWLFLTPSPWAFSPGLVWITYSLSVCCSEDPKIAPTSSWSLDCALHSLLLGSGWGAGVWFGMGSRTNAPRQTRLHVLFQSAFKVWKCWLTIWQIITNLELCKYMQFLPFTAAFFFRYPVFPNTPTYSKYHFCIFCVILAYPISYPHDINIAIPFLYLLCSLSVGIPFIDVAARFYTFLPKTHPRSSPHWSSAMSSLLGLWKMWQKRILTPVKSHGRATGMCRWFSFQPPKWWCILMRNM